MDKLADITAQGWIMAYFIRSDGERFLLGTGAYDFKSDLQHFQPNAMANDIVELQGTDGQLLAGQVRRSATQSFDGYVGDSTQNRERIEELRRDFLMFFRKNFFYKTVYIYPNGTAIQRKRGYLVDAPSVPELYQFFPEYHVALNYEDPNYYEYAEDAQGDEIFANILAIALTTPSAGGLVWDAIGAVSHGYIWSNPQTASGSSFQITGIEGAPLTLTELKGNATQNGTPTPTAPVAVNTTTGENVVKITGKNLLDKSVGFTNKWINSNGAEVAGNTNALFNGYIKVAPNTAYTLSFKSSVYNMIMSEWNESKTFVKQNIKNASTSYTITTQATTEFLRINFNYNGSTTVTQDIIDSLDIQLELGSTATSYEPYQGQDYEVNLGKNLLKPYQTSGTLTNVAGVSASMNSDGTMTLNGTATGNGWVEFVYAFRNGTQAQTAPQVLLDSTATYTLSSSVISGTATGSPIFYIQPTSASTSEQYATLGNTKTFTGADGIYRGWIRVMANQVYDNAKIGFQVELGSATDYAPYFAPIELAKIGTYQDRIYKNDGKWYVEKQIEKLKLESSQGWTKSGSVTAVTRFYIRDYLPVGTMPIERNSLIVLSNYFKGITQVQSDAKNTGISQLEDRGLMINVENGVFADATAFGTWLDANDVLAYYALATPTTTEITNETLLSQLNFIANLYGGTNNIMLVGTGAQGEIEVEYMTEVDVDGAGYEWEAGGDGGETTITLDAVEAVRPVWAVTGPATDPTLTNITTGETIAFTGTVPASQTLTVDMDARTATMAGANVFQYITGDWLRLEPGNNRMSYTATGTTEPSTLSWNGVVG